MKSILRSVLRTKSLFGFLLVLGFLGLFLMLPSKAEAAAPIGHVDGVTGSAVIQGWALDPDAAGAHIEIHAYFDGPAGRSKTVVGSSTTYARCDVKFLANDCGFQYGWDVLIPTNLQDGREHTAYIYAVDIRQGMGSESGWPKTGASTLLTGSPKKFKVGGASNVRHARGAVVSHNNTVYFIGEQLRYPFPSADVFFSWGLNFKQVVPANNGDLLMPVGAMVKYKGETDSLTDRLPMGNVDRIINSRLQGWAMDLDHPNTALDVYVYVDTPRHTQAFTYVFTASSSRPDVNSAFSVSGNHGFDIDLTQISSLFDGQSHTLHVYMPDIDDSNTLAAVQIPGSPIVFQATSAPQDTASVQQRDAERVSEVQTLIAILGSYYHDYGYYPTGELLILDGESLSSNGWGFSPSGTIYSSTTRPAPPADGSCTSTQNSYTYTRLSLDEFVITFCLGGIFNNLSAGVHGAYWYGIR
jgi:hypothetical protein